MFMGLKEELELYRSGDRVRSENWDNYNWYYKEREQRSILVDRFAGGRPLADIRVVDEKAIAPFLWTLFIPSDYVHISGQPICGKSSTFRHARDVSETIVHGCSMEPLEKRYLTVQEEEAMKAKQKPKKNAEPEVDAGDLGMVIDFWQDNRNGIEYQVRSLERHEDMREAAHRVFNHIPVNSIRGILYGPKKLAINDGVFHALTIAQLNDITREFHRLTGQNRSPRIIETNRVAANRIVRDPFANLIRTAPIEPANLTVTGRIDEPGVIGGGGGAGAATFPVGAGTTAGVVGTIATAPGTDRPLGVVVDNNADVLFNPDGTVRWIRTTWNAGTGAATTGTGNWNNDDNEFF